MVKTYSILVWICFIFSLALTAFTCYIAFSKSSLVQCYDKDLNEVDCSKIFNTGRKVGLVVSSVIGLLFQLCKSISRDDLDKPSHTSSLPPQTSASSSGDTLISSRTNRPTRTTLVSTRRARPTTPSRASRARTACWTANTDYTVERYPVQTRVFSLCQLPLLLLTSICLCLFVFSLVFPYLQNLTIVAARDTFGVVENVSAYGWSWDM